MKKILLLLSILFLFGMQGNAQQRSEREALALASSFLGKKPEVASKSTANNTLSLAYVCSDEQTKKRSSADNAYFYVFNIGNNNGFVIVSGDERANSILGYSDNGGFDINKIPDNFKNWLSFYKDELTLLSAQPINDKTSNVYADTKVNNNVTTKTYPASVSPLLSSIKWDQGTPYNNLCPVDSKSGERTVTGCAATGMAQVMRYHKWPNKGVGSKTYTSETLKFTLSADFGATTYDWGNMINTYDFNLGTDAQKSAVATLMYHCGVSLNMDYNISSAGGSAALFSDIPIALVNYFGYDERAQIYSRNFYSKSDWKNLLKRELAASRPVLYSGYGDEGGHLFVCDGYNSEGLFHFNWGWSGQSDGYFEVTALNPLSLGIGGGNGDGFNSGQQILGGVRKKDSSIDLPVNYQIVFEGPLSVGSPSVSTGRNNPFKVTLSNKTYNAGINTFEGALGFALYKEDGTFVTELAIVNNSVKLENDEGYEGISVDNVKIPATVANGDYRLYPVFKSTTDTKWSYIRGAANTHQYLNVQVTATNVALHEYYTASRLTVNSVEAYGYMYSNFDADFKLSVTCTNADYMNSYIGIKVVNKANNTINKIVAKDKYYIENGETKEIMLTGKLAFDDGTPIPAGEYEIHVMYDKTNSESEELSSIAKISGTILEEPIISYINLELTEMMAFADGNNIITPTSKFDLVAKIVNKGDYFNNKVLLYAQTLYNGSYIIEEQTVTLDKGASKTIRFTKGFPADFPFGELRLRLYYFNEKQGSYNQFGPERIALTAATYQKDPTVGIDTDKPASEGLKIYPSLATDILHIESQDAIKTIRIFDLLGKQMLTASPDSPTHTSISVNQIPSGTYIIQIETDNKLLKEKFIKK